MYTTTHPRSSLISAFVFQLYGPGDKNPWLTHVSHRVHYHRVTGSGFSLLLLFGGRHVQAFPQSIRFSTDYATSVVAPLGPPLTGRDYRCFPGFTT